MMVMVAATILVVPLLVPTTTIVAAGVVTNADERIPRGVRGVEIAWPGEAGYEASARRSLLVTLLVVLL